jgi:thioredoxin 1
VTVNYTQDAEFDTLLADSGLVMVDCTATWCGPCRKISPLMDQLSKEYKGRATVVKLDVDENKVTAKKLGIRSIPAVLIFKDSNLVETIVGVSPYEIFRDALEKHL